PATPLSGSGRPLSMDDDDEDDEDEELPKIAKPAAFSASSVSNASAAPGIPAMPPKPVVPQKSAEELEAERLASLPPAKPRGTGTLPRQDEASSRFGATSFGAKPATGNPAERQDRLNAIRSGNLADIKPEDAVEDDDEAPVTAKATPATSAASPFAK